MKKINRAFSLVELSIVILIIGVLVAAVGQGVDLLAEAKVKAAKELTQSSRVASLKGLGLWFESTMDSSFLASEAVDGVSISTWYDSNTQVGTRSNAVQTDATKRPTYTESAINGIPALKFNGTSSYFQILDSSSFYGGSAGMTLFFVAASGNVDTVQDVFRMGQSAAFALTSTGAGSANAKCGSFYTNNYGTNWFGSWNPAGSPAIAKGQPVICVSRYDGSNIQGATNGGSLSTIQAMTGNITGTSSGYVLVGIGHPSGAEPFAGFIGEIIMFTRALTQKEIDTVESYLSKKWGIKTI